MSIIGTPLDRGQLVIKEYHQRLLYDHKTRQTGLTTYRQHTSCQSQMPGQPPHDLIFLIIGHTMATTGIFPAILPHKSLLISSYHHRICTSNSHHIHPLALMSVPEGVLLLSNTERQWHEVCKLATNWAPVGGSWKLRTPGPILLPLTHLRWQVLGGVPTSFSPLRSLLEAEMNVQESIRWIWGVNIGGRMRSWLLALSTAFY